ncbi:TonB box-containing protein [Marasmius fiardii PR-910]|nr:TonB box-containing protein [Marasmius fiardii PR-910]
MDLFLVPNNPERTVLVSLNGVAHYQVTTDKVANSGRRVLRLQRPAESEEDSIIAEIEWKTWEYPTVLRSSLLKHKARRRVNGKTVGVLGTEFLYKRSHFTSTRYFLGNDNVEYRWKIVKGIGCVLTHGETSEEIARFTYASTDEGLYAGERKSRLRIQPCSVDIDLIVLSFLMMEKKRRDRAGDKAFALLEQNHDEDPQGEGDGGDGGGG